MSVPERPRVTMGFPWEIRESGYRCSLRVPGYRYDTEDGYHVSVTVARDTSRKWRLTVCGSVRKGSYVKLDDAIRDAELALVEATRDSHAEAVRKVAMWEGLLEQIGAKP